jgi:hypothetical protein
MHIHRTAPASKTPQLCKQNAQYTASASEFGKAAMSPATVPKQEPFGRNRRCVQNWHTVRPGAQGSLVRRSLPGLAHEPLWADGQGPLPRARHMDEEMAKKLGPAFLQTNGLLMLHSILKRLSDNKRANGSVTSPPS